MVDWLRYALMAGGVLVAISAYFGWRSNTAPGRICLLLSVATEALVLAQTVVVAVKLATGRHVAEPATIIGYLSTLVILLPAAWWWSRLEQSKWGAVVVVVAGLVVAVLTARLQQLWVAPA
ncbi:hypothetical protein CLV47_10255 [Antricoccus suffuscus]|uniref:Integral membrane protein n=1 Tax=Antricoccus suffuscus TaxID=1629062 RepID=A0A2T1A427_9ACTN|nr:hypothetical protein [Antricoccus suffuscus]PRZ43370.1 hypothetical protein CLV47_10255 [Antricoccus suffuscus]